MTSSSSPQYDQPQAVAYDGTEFLYVLIPGNYVPSGESLAYDVIMLLETDGTYSSFIPSPGASWMTEALAFVDVSVAGTDTATLFAAYNEWDNSTFTYSGTVKKYDAATQLWSAVNGMSGLDAIGGMASDGESLFVAFRDELTITKHSVDSGAVLTTYDLSNAWSSDGGGGGGGGFGMMGMGMAGGPPIMGFDSLAYIDGNLIGGQMNNIISVDASTGQKADEDWMSNDLMNTKGLTVVQETWGGEAADVIYSVTTMYPGKIKKAQLEGGEAAVETTPVGAYTATFTVVADGTTYTETDTFSIDKLTSDPTVTITTPLANFAAGEGDETITVSGTVDDPSISSVTVGIALPTVTSFTDDQESASVSATKWEHAVTPKLNSWFWNYSSTDLWHLSDDQNHTTGGGTSWRYGVDGSANFNTSGEANAAGLSTRELITLGTGNTLSFWTYYDTETDFYMDRKLVEVSTDGITWTTVKWIAQFWPPFNPPDIDSDSWATLTHVEPNSWTQVDVDLSDFGGSSVYVRFHFDSFDDWGNNGEGWYIDDVTISGAGFQGTAATVQDDLTYSTSFTLAEGSNTITASAVRTAYTPLSTGTASVTGSLDTAGPTISLTAVTSPTNTGTQLIGGVITELNFDRLTVAVNGTTQYSTTNLTEVSTGIGSWTNTVTLTGGSNTILITATDDVGLSSTETATIAYDAAGPAFGAVFADDARYEVAYKVGESSARALDYFYISLYVTDVLTDVASVKLQIPNTAASDWPSALETATMPEAIIDSWGISATAKAAMNYVMPMTLPSGAPAGNYYWTVTAYDTAGNSADISITTTVVTTLTAFNIYLMPDWNLVSTPLIPTDTSLDTLTSDLEDTTLFERIWYYDAEAAGTSDAWLLYEPGVSSDLSVMTAGKGYWIKMKDLAAFGAAGKVSDPMAAGLPNTPEPIKLSISGEVLPAGATVPPSYSVYEGWNLIGLHSEVPRLVSTALGSVSVPTQTWGSMLQYLNYMEYPEEEGGTPVIDLGRFDRMVATDTMSVGRGFWLYMVADGTLVP